MPRAAPPPTPERRRPRLRARATSGLLLIGLVAVACGDDGTPETDAPATAPSTTTAPTTTVAPDAADRPSVLIAGDSVLEEAAGPLAFAIEATGQALAEFSLGPDLPRDEADGALWQAALERTDPDLIVVSVGHWEYLSVLGDFAEGELLAPGSYPDQVLEPFVDLITATGARVLWVGPAVIADPDEAEFVDGLEEDFGSLAERRPEVDFVDADTWLAPEGFAETLPGPDGEPVPVRRADGIHLCPAGQVLLAEGLLGEVAERLELDPDPGWAQDWRAGQDPEPGGCAPDYQG